MAGSDAIVGVARHMLILEHSLLDDIYDIEEVGGDYVIEESNINKEKYIDWICVSFWNSYLTLRYFIDALMHLLFLGVTNATHKLAIKWI